MAKQIPGLLLILASLCSAFEISALDAYAQRRASGQIKNQQPHAKVKIEKSDEITSPIPASPAPVESIAKRRWMPSILSREQFDVMARTFNPDLLHPLPHMLFVIDRQQQNKIYYVNMRYFNLHEVFVNSLYLSLERGRTFWENNHLKDNRRFICGRVVYQTAINRFCFEFWEGDTISSEQLALTAEVINKSFFQPVAFKPASAMQEAAAAKAQGMESVNSADLAREVRYQPLNVGRGIGRLRIVRQLNDYMTINTSDILVLDETPITMPPVAGIVMARMSSPLSHVNLLARSWGVPNAFIMNADKALAGLDGKWVTYQTTPGGYQIELADRAAMDEYRRSLDVRRRRMTPHADLSVRAIADLREQRASLAAAYGAKSANLAEVMNARIAGVSVPDGWTIPVFYFDQFMRENKLQPFIRTMLADARFRRDTSYRRERLAQIRSLIRQGALNREFRREVLARANTPTAGDAARTGVFVRSSSNTEDLPNFNGAGLYDTVPNVREEKELLQAIKTVWASVWNFEAFETRERAGIDHTQAMMAVLVQQGINAESAGVMITTDPFNDANQHSVYINAKRGLGIRVVEGKRIAEQILYEPRSKRLDVLTRSAEDSLLEFDDAGGIREVPIKGTRVVLIDRVVRRLADAAIAIKRHFGGVEQDIEWAIRDGKIYIVQSRPYITVTEGAGNALTRK
jgi:hypothetical protein